MNRPVVAVFDFDGTLHEGVSGLRFFRRLLGPGRYYGWFWIRHLPSLLSYGLRWRHERALEIINHAVFAGRDANQVAQAAKRFSREELPHALVPAAMERLAWHQAQGHRCAIVSRGYELYLRDWAKSRGIADVAATRLEVDAEGRLTGRMPEPSCDAERKLERLLRMIGDPSSFELHVYGDGPGDHAMFAVADRAWLRTPAGFVPFNREEMKT